MFKFWGARQETIVELLQLKQRKVSILLVFDKEEVEELLLCCSSLVGRYSLLVPFLLLRCFLSRGITLCYLRLSCSSLPTYELVVLLRLIVSSLFQVWILILIHGISLMIEFL